MLNVLITGYGLMVGYLSWIKLNFPQTFSSSPLSRPHVPTVCWTFLAQCPIGPQLTMSSSEFSSLTSGQPPPLTPAPGKVTSFSQSPRPETGSHPWLILSLFPWFPNPGWSPWSVNISLETPHPSPFLCSLCCCHGPSLALQAPLQALDSTVFIVSTVFLSVKQG